MYNLPVIINQLPPHFRNELIQFQRAGGNISVELLETLVKVNQAFGLAINHFGGELQARYEQLSRAQDRLTERRRWDIQDSRERREAARQVQRSRSFFASYFQRLGFQVTAEGLNEGDALALYEQWSFKKLQELSRQLTSLIAEVSRQLHRD